MAERKFYVDINLLQSELKNGVIHTVDTFGDLPAGALEGQFAYVIALKLVHVFDGLVWKPVGDIPQFRNGDVVNTTGEPKELNIVDLSVDNIKLANKTILSGKIADGEVKSINIENNTVGNDKLALVGANTMKGNNTAGLAEVKDLTIAEVTTMLNCLSDLDNGTSSTTVVTIVDNNSSGSTVTIDGATTSAAGVMTSAHVVSLNTWINQDKSALAIVMTADDATVDIFGMSQQLIKVATATKAGLLLPAEKTRIGNALLGVNINLQTPRNATTIVVENDAGTDATLIEADTNYAGVMTSAMFDELEKATADIASITLDYVATNATTNHVSLAIDGRVTQTKAVHLATLPTGTDKAGLLSPGEKKIIADVSGLTLLDITTIVYKSISDMSDTLTGIDWITDSDQFGNDDGSEDSSTYSKEVPTKAAVRKFVKRIVEGIGEFRGGYDAVTDSPVLDESNAGSQIQDIVIGDYWIVEVAGDFFTTKAVASGDRIIANVNSGAGAGAGGNLILSDFTVVKPSFNNATDSEHGLVRLATEADIDGKTAHESVAVTPLRLAYALEGPTSTVANKKTATFGDGGTTLFNFTHTFGWGVTVQIFDNSNVQVEAQVTITDTNVNLEFNVAPVSGFRVVIVG